MVVVDLGFCPRCGSQLEPLEEHDRKRLCCTVCDFTVYQNPFPVVVATVVDVDRALFVKRAQAPDKGAWSMPGGYMEVDEAPVEGAARELYEETGIEADPDDLTFIGTHHRELDPERSVVELLFAIPQAQVRGKLQPGDDAADVRFWTREEIEKNPSHLRAGDINPILHAIDTIGKADSTPLW